MISSKVISYLFDQGLKKVKTLIRGRADVQTSFEAGAFGVDGRPPRDWRAIYSKTQSTDQSIIVGYINKHQLEDLPAGANRFYSTDEAGDNVSSFIYLQNDGTAQVLGEGDFMVRYNALEAAFNELKDDHNGLAQKWDAFANAYAPGGPSSLGTPPTATAAGSSSADITPAKIEELKTIP